MPVTTSVLPESGPSGAAIGSRLGDVMSTPADRDGDGHTMDDRARDALRTSTRLLMRQGFRARSAIHPAQVAVINEVLTPSDDEVTRAREQVAAFEAAGGGATGDAVGAEVGPAVTTPPLEVVGSGAGIDEDGGGAAGSVDSRKAEFARFQ